MAKQIAKVVCPRCQAAVFAYRARKGRIIVTSSTGLVFAGLGVFVGATIGIASGGTGLAGTVPLAVVGAVVGTGSGYILSDKTLDRPKCPKCDGPIEAGI